MFLVEMQQKFSDDITHLQKSFVFLPPKVYDAMKQCLGIMDTESYLNSTSGRCYQGLTLCL